MIALDDNIEDHPKFVSLSDDSFALWVRCIGYCRRNLTDGFVPEQAARARCRGKRQPAAIIAELTSRPVGMPTGKPLWSVVDGGYQVHDYLGRWNPSRVEVEAIREQKRSAGARGGRRSGESRNEAKAQAEPKQTPSTTEAPCFDSASRSASPVANPDPIRSDPIRSEEEFTAPGGGGVQSAPVGARPARAKTPKPATEAPVAPTSDHRALSDHYCARFLEVRGVEATFKSREGKSNASLIEQFGLNEAKRRVDVALSDPFWSKKVTINDIARDPDKFATASLPLGGRGFVQPAAAPGEPTWTERGAGNPDDNPENWMPL